MKINKLNLLTIIMLTLVSILAYGSYTYADTNGIWHFAKDIQGGVFGQDEQDVTNYYRFINPVYFDSDINVSGNSTFVDIYADNIYVNEDLYANQVYSSGNKVATLDNTGKVPLSQLPFRKGDLISPADRPLINGLPEYQTEYFSISNLGISGTSASNVVEGVTFGPGKNMVGSLSKNNICNTAGGNANCGVSLTSIMPGTYYTLIGVNSPTQTSYCSKLQIFADGTITNTNINTAATCKYISQCDSSAQIVVNYPDSTNCGSGKSCVSGICQLDPTEIVLFSGYSFTRNGKFTENLIYTKPIPNNIDTAMVNLQYSWRPSTKGSGNPNGGSYVSVYINDVLVNHKVSGKNTWYSYSETYPISNLNGFIKVNFVVHSNYGDRGSSLNFNKGIYTTTGFK